MTTKKTKKRAPGPSLISLLGEIEEKDPDFFVELQQEYGDVVKIPGIINNYLISDPDLVHYILKTNPDNFIKGGLIYKLPKAALGNGLLLSNGEEWRCRRKLTAPFFQTNHIAKFTPMIHEKVLQRIERWYSYANNNEGFDIAHELMAIVFNITVKTLYHNEVEDERLDKILECIRLENKFAVFGAYLPAFVPIPNNIRYRRARRYLKKYITDMITARKQSGLTKNDLLDTLIHAKHADGITPLTEKELYDEVKTFLMTGHETTGSALSWAWYLLAKHPSHLQKVKEEVKQVLQGRMPDYNDVEKLTYTQHVFDEGLRLYPPIWLTGRKVLHDDFLGNYFIKARSEVLFSPYVIHRHPAYWDDPETFNPDRHCAEIRKKRPRFAFIPFGGGPRICIASHLAVMESVMIIAMIAQRFDIELVPEHEVEMEGSISLRPRHGIKVRVKPI